MTSIIIPVYNEERTIEGLLNSLPYDDGLEVIIADGGSNDRTIEFAKRYSIRVIQCNKNRALQMNEGARASKGDILIFLYADCILEEGSLKTISDCIDRGFAGGSLTHKISSPKLIYRLIERSGNIRARLFKIFYGDQAIFVRRDVFFKIGGFCNVELFDDVLFSKNLKKIGKTCVLNKKVYTSSRRWEKKGIVKTTLINWVISLGFLLWVSPDKLKKIYHDIR